MKNKIKIIGVPMDLGADRRGVDMGPSGVRIAGLSQKIRALGYEVEDIGNIPVKLAETIEIGNRRAKYLPEIAEASEALARTVLAILESDCSPLILGGDHSIAIGSVSGIAQHFHPKAARVGIIWIDAHLDINTPETSQLGNIHG